MKAGSMTSQAGIEGRSHLDKAEDRFDDLPALGAQQRQDDGQQLWRTALQLWHEFVQ